MYIHYIDKDKPGTFAQALARDAVFGPDVMWLCTPNGSKNLRALHQNGLFAIKRATFHLYPQCWSNFEAVWNRCQRAIEQACGRLKRRGLSRKGGSHIL